MDINKHIVRLKGKEYLMVAGRVILAHEDPKAEKLSIVTEYVPELSSEQVITMKATVTTPKGVFTGYSSARFGANGPEGSATVEVAETSAVGRALGFAGYGTDYGIATAEEMRKVGITEESSDGEPPTRRTAGRCDPGEETSARADLRNQMCQMYQAAKRKKPSLPPLEATIQQRYHKDVSGLKSDEVSALITEFGAIAQGR